MLATQMEAYRKVQKTTQSGRELEALVLTKAAFMLQQVQNDWDASDRDSRLEEALNYNQRIWSIFQSELASADNPLPKMIRENILSLSLFIDKRILEIMAQPVPEKLAAIININISLAAGLRSAAAAI
jgi:flagellar protein FlaF